ncbi:MAG: DUF938 domain-containing protein [Sulfitobacter sp.]|nr:DUF938 domain-containing protein [Sulfitobacter sp.]
MRGPLPPTASVAEEAGGGKLYAPAAERNAAAIAALLVTHAPRTGRALEIASGTGQHLVAFAQTLPDLDWQPTDVEEARRASIDARVAEAGVTNSASAVPLDLGTPGWSDEWPPFDLIVLVNLLHLLPTPTVTTGLQEIGKALAPGGLFLLYGPFKRAGVLTSAGDARFDAELREADPLIGYKDDRDLHRWAADAGLTVTDQIEMPANNLVFLCRKAA